MSKCDDEFFFPFEHVSEWDKPELPEGSEVLLFVTPKKNKICPELDSIYRLPIGRILPGSTFQPNTYSVYAPAGSVAPPTTYKVIPAFTNQNGTNIVTAARADSTSTLAKYIIIGDDPNADDRVYIQSSGYLTFPNAHTYKDNIGKTYYLSATESGEVVSTAPTSPNTAQPLFVVIDATTIQIIV